MKRKLDTFYIWKILSCKIGIFWRFSSVNERKYPKLPLGHPKIPVNVIGNLVRITKIPKFNSRDHSESLWNYGLHVSVFYIWYFEPCRKETLLCYRRVAYFSLLKVLSNESVGMGTALKIKIFAIVLAHKHTKYIFSW